MQFLQDVLLYLSPDLSQWHAFDSKTAWWCRHACHPGHLSPDLATSCLRLKSSLSAVRLLPSDISKLVQVERHLESEDVVAAVEDAEAGSQDVVPGEDFLDMGVSEDTESDCQSESPLHATLLDSCIWGPLRTETECSSPLEL